MPCSTAGARGGDEAPPSPALPSPHLPSGARAPAAGSAPSVHRRSLWLACAWALPKPAPPGGLLHPLHAGLSCPCAFVERRWCRAPVSIQGVLTASPWEATAAPGATTSAGAPPTTCCSWRASSRAPAKGRSMGEEGRTEVFLQPPRGTGRARAPRPGAEPGGFEERGGIPGWALLTCRCSCWYSASLADSACASARSSSSCVLGGQRHSVGLVPPPRAAAGGVPQHSPCSSPTGSHERIPPPSTHGTERSSATALDSSLCPPPQATQGHCHPPSPIVTPPAP